MKQVHGMSGVRVGKSEVPETYTHHTTPHHRTHTQTQTLIHIYTLHAEETDLDGGRDRGAIHI
jgi:hypothetical protein